MAREASTPGTAGRGPSGQQERRAGPRRARKAPATTPTASADPRARARGPAGRRRRAARPSARALRARRGTACRSPRTSRPPSRCASRRRRTASRPRVAAAGPTGSARSGRSQHRRRGAAAARRPPAAGRRAAGRRRERGGRWRSTGCTRARPAAGRRAPRAARARRGRAATSRHRQPSGRPDRAVVRRARRACAGRRVPPSRVRGLSRRRPRSPRAGVLHPRSRHRRAGARRSPTRSSSGAAAAPTASCSPARPASGGATSPPRSSPPRSGRGRRPGRQRRAGRRPRRADEPHALRVDALRLRDLDRRRGHRPDLRDVLRRAGAVEPRRLRRRRRRRRDRRARGAASTACAATCPTSRTSWQLDAGGLDELAAAGREVPEQRARGAPGGAHPRQPRDDHLHLRHHRPAQGLRAHPPQPAHASAAAPRAMLPELFDGSGSTLLFLPLAHVFARFVQVACVETRLPDGPHGRHQEPAARPRHASRPTFLLSVPRVFEKVYNSSQAEGRTPTARARSSTAPSGRDRLVDRRSTPGAPAWRCGCSTRCSTGSSTASCGPPWAAVAVRRLGRRAARRRGSGHFFRGIGITILEGYGLTETSAPSTVNLPDRHPHRHGRQAAARHDGPHRRRRRGPRPGDQVFRGYWRNEAATAEVLRDGWFTHRRPRRARRRRLPAHHRPQEGDPRDRRRQERRPGRARGPPARPPAGQPVHGRRRPEARSSPAWSPSTPRRCPAWAERARQAGGTTAAELVDDPELRAELQRAVDDANLAVSKAEAIRKFAVLPDDWTEEGGQITPSLKVKRVGRHGGATPTTSSGCTPARRRS